MLITPSATLVSLVLPFEGESSTAPLIIFLVGILYFAICMFLSSFLTVSQHVQHGLGQACLIIGLIVLPSMQVR